MSSGLKNDDYSLIDLFRDYVFYVPEYQRFYSWSTREWEDLWDDLRNIPEQHSHYMGTVILEGEVRQIDTEELEQGYSEYAIVDGQQRLTTLVVLVKAIRSAFEVRAQKGGIPDHKIFEKVSGFVEDARPQFIRHSVIQDDLYEAENKLRLQEGDDEILRDVLRGEIDEGRVQMPSEQRIVDAYRFYEERLDNLPSESFVREVGRLIQNIKSLEFMVYVVDEDNPIRSTQIFESVNDRGKDLSRLDKTKSFLMHKQYLSRAEKNGAHEDTGEPSDIRSRFGHIYRSMQTVERQDRTSGIKEDQVQRYHYIAQIDPEVNSTYLKEKTSRTSTTLQRGGPIYLEILKWHFNCLYDEVETPPHSEYSRACLEEIEEYTTTLRNYYERLKDIAQYDEDEVLSWELSKLFALGRVGNFYPLLLEMWGMYVDGKVSRSELREVLQMIEVVSFRIYAIEQKRADTGRSRLYRLANGVASGEKGVDDISSELKGIVETYESGFQEALQNKDAYDAFSAKDLRYLLYSYDLWVRELNKGGPTPEFEKAVQNAGEDYSLDHVWPKKTSKLGLTGDEKKAHDRLLHSLGNLTLAPGRQNSAWRDAPYQKKREEYLNSDFPSTRKLAHEYKSWGRSSIESRLEEIVEYATRRWSLEPDRRRELAEIKPSA